MNGTLVQTVEVSCEILWDPPLLEFNDVDE